MVNGAFTTLTTWEKPENAIATWSLYYAMRDCTASQNEIASIAFCGCRGYSLSLSLYIKGLGITTNILRLSNSKMYGKRTTIKKPRYSRYILPLSSWRSHCITERQIAEKFYQPRQITPTEDQHIILHIIQKWQNPNFVKYSTPKAKYRNQIFATADLYHKIFETAKPRSNLFSPYLP